MYSFKFRNDYHEEVFIFSFFSLFVINGQAIDDAPLVNPASMLQQSPVALPGSLGTQEVFKKGEHFTPEEDDQLMRLFCIYGKYRNKWNLIAREIPGRTAKQCRERWHHYLNPNLNEGSWTPEEDVLLLEKYQKLGPKWSKIARFFQRRSPRNVQNRYHVLKMGEVKGESLPQ